MRKLPKISKFEVGDIVRPVFLSFNLFLVIEKNEINYKLYWINHFPRSEQIMLFDSKDYVERRYEKVA
jgi:hypothetical protein